MPRAKRIPSGDFVSFAPAVVGEQVNVDHTDCTAGTDTKKRLYIKRTEAGLVAFCHNCGLGGWYIEKGGRVRKPKHVDVDPPHTGVYTTASFGGIQRATGYRYRWLMEYVGTRFSIVEKYVLSLVPEAKGVDGNPLVYLMIDSRGDVYGYQLRWTDGRLPKTKTYLNRRPMEGGWFGNASSDKVVLVEDPLSAAIVSATMGTKVAVHCLFGTKLSEIGEAALAKYQTKIIWLDNDKPGIAASKKICDRLAYLYGSDHLYNLAGINAEEPKKTFNIEEVLRPYV